ncbi:MAG TPA: hypothetical protein VGM32_05885, partial [Rhodopila sp.]
LQDLNAITSDLGTIASAMGGMQPPPPPGSEGSPGQSGGGVDLTNTGTAWANRAWGDGPSGSGGGWQQQLLIASYMSGNGSVQNSGTTSALPSITA